MRSNRSETDRRRTTRGGKAGQIILSEDSVPRTRSKQSPPRSPARTRRVSPAGKSPARKSPARKSPVRKSPARKSPARKSPSRKSQPKPTTGKSPPRAEKGRTETEIRKPFTLKSKNEDKPETLIIPSDTKSIAQIRPTLKSTRSSRRIEYTMRDLTVNINSIEVSQNNGVESTTSDETDGIRKRKPREISSIKAMRFSSSIEKETEPVVSSKSSYGDSDEERSEEEVSPTEKCVSRRLATPLKDMNISDIMASFGTRWEFGGKIGSLILIPLVPLLFFSLVAWSECRTCTIKSVPDLKSYISISIWFNKSSALLYSSLIVLQIFLCILPIFGRRILSLESGGKSFFFNCPFAVVITIAVAVVLHCFGICKARDVLADYFKLSATSYLVGVLFSIAVFIKSRKLHEDKLNLYANTGFISYDFMMGRELHPTIFNKLNVKILLHTISCSTSMTLLVYLLLQASRIDDLTKFHDKGIPDTLLAIKINPTFLFFALLQISYISLWTWTDYQRISMFSWQSEGVGYLNIVCTLIYPFFFVLIPKYILDNNIVLDPKLLGGLGVIFTIAWFVCRYSNHVKYEIRRNPANPDLLHLNLMPTFHGKRLIVNGLWGWIRHPNYTADIIMHLILAVPGVMASSISAAPALFTIFHLIYRASRDSERCRRRYGAAWQRYCARVPSVVVPKVY